MVAGPGLSVVAAALAAGYSKRGSPARAMRIRETGSLGSKPMAAASDRGCCVIAELARERVVEAVAVDDLVGGDLHDGHVPDRIWLCPSRG